MLQLAMRSIRLIILFASCVMVDADFSFYYSNNPQVSHVQFDCLYARLNDRIDYMDEPFIHNYHLIPYCRRPNTNEEKEKLSIFNSEMGRIIRFADLKKQGVTSVHLLAWGAPIDVAERYEKNDDNSQDEFYNCTSPWFGSTCQYTFDYDTPPSFSDIVNTTFAYRYNEREVVKNSTCYSFITNCYRGPSPACLDWREICNGIFDCLNGEDEQMCEQLELSECTNDEYRCHYGGQCIPLMFLRDSSRSADCLDGSDEMDTRQDNIRGRIPTFFKVDCNTIPTFLCEEIICRSVHSFSCGNGHCAPFQVDTFDIKRCANRHREKMIQNLIISRNHVSDIACQQALHCLIRISNHSEYPYIFSWYDDFNNSQCEPLTMHCSSEWIAIPPQPIFLDFFQLIYLTNRSVAEFENNILPDFVCFNPQRCPGLLQIIVRIDLNNGLACCNLSDIASTIPILYFDEMYTFLSDAIERCLKIGTDFECSHPSLFHCSTSLKCISRHRLVDGYKDCYFNEDESCPACHLNDSNRYQCASNSTICFSSIAVRDNIRNCPEGEDERSSHEQKISEWRSFSSFCRIRLEANLNLSTLTGCEGWPCHNPYTHCDNLWNCPNGIDELNCPDSKCSWNEHSCYSYISESRICLPVEHLYEAYIDDCDLNDTQLRRIVHFNNRTDKNDMNKYISWNNTKCITADKICRRHSLGANFDDELCQVNNYQMYIDHDITIRTNNGTSMCSYIDYDWDRNVETFLSFVLIVSRFGFFPPTSMNYSNQIISMANQTSTISPNINISQSWYCNRGILIRFGYNKTKKCLCPPSYFGDQCQWQNQRISLTLQLLFRNTTTSNNAVFQVVIMLVDDQSGQITPYHEQITFVPTRDCNTKLNIYLLYPDRPKRVFGNYSIRVDVFHKRTLEYYVSWHLSIPFLFLPVNRLAARLFMFDTPEDELCPLLCGTKGKCRRYLNKKSVYFCQCDEWYSGSSCHISHTCSCSNDSLCLSPSICVCPLNKFGLQCHLNNSICQSVNNPCQNNGLCIPIDDRIALNKFTCLCPEGYFGETCETTQTSINIHFDEHLIESVSSVFIHFIAAFQDKKYERTSTFKKIPFAQNMITLYVQQPFNILFIELSKQEYYLTVVREIFLQSEVIDTRVQPNQRCPIVHELVNTTLQNYSSFLRVQYYPLLCRQNTQLRCFYDELYICLCDLDRFSNCLDFNHSMSYDCQGQNDCHHGGQCFENNATCPTLTMCICPDCYYGARCQFSTKGFMLSLDPILGYQVKPNVPLHWQPLIVKVSIAIVTLMMAFELVNGFLSLLTFRMSPTREVGCGLYLLASSIFSLCTIVVLVIKYCFLVLSQKMDITNRLFLNVNCIVTDASLKTLLATSEWFNACVALERTFAVMKGINFDKNKSKRTAKWITFILPILILLTYIHDPIHRRLIDDFDVDEQRTWCFIEYSSSFDIYNSVINFIHFLAPLLINLISAVVIIVSSARIRSNAQASAPLKQHLLQQLREHKQLLLAPCVHVLLGVPRLIIPFIKGCMRMSPDPWLFLIGYSIPFISVMLTFFTHVLPSKKYMKEFGVAWQRTLRTFGLTTSV